jgi:hypothetical protein
MQAGNPKLVIVQRWRSTSSGALNRKSKKQNYLKGLRPKFIKKRSFCKAYNQKYRLQHGGKAAATGATGKRENRGRPKHLATELLQPSAIRLLEGSYIARCTPHCNFLDDQVHSAV